MIYFNIFQSELAPHYWLLIANFRRGGKKELCVSVQCFTIAIKHLNYRKIIYEGLPLKIVQKLQLAKNVADFCRMWKLQLAQIHVVVGIQKFEFAELLLLWLPVHFQVQFKVLVSPWDHHQVI